MSNKNGSKWITRKRRLILYIRDGFSCVWCGIGIEDGAQLTLDHVQPRELGGGHENENLVTCCYRCNSRRGMRPVEEFAFAVAGYVDHGVTAREVALGVWTQTQASVKKAKKEAEYILEHRPQWARVMAAARKGDLL